MPGRHHDRAVFGHGASSGSSSRRRMVSLLGLDQNQPYWGDADHISAHSFCVRICNDIRKRMFSSLKIISSTAERAGCAYCAKDRLTSATAEPQSFAA